MQKIQSNIYVKRGLPPRFWGGDYLLFLADPRLKIVNPDEGAETSHDT